MWGNLLHHLRIMHIVVVVVVRYMMIWSFNSVVYSNKEINMALLLNIKF